ncbi:hypothetical protein AJ80_04742 [Polytolypa hystricis UAMH7299]|uniref:Uncharacterized protein n=1 Tax=Polytolypa hystricis (strain UAMH7299) TaxID=1447883 RepID=A0A2B7Y0H6_POLH7|nr:hypothetical protein AJ80_04742 [Polytolypa hystricis UAMH7299]
MTTSQDLTDQMASISLAGEGSSPALQSPERLDRIVDISYLGKPYFTDEEVVALKNTVMGPGSETLANKIETILNERLNRRMKKHVESGDFRVCAAHDLALIFEKGFGVNPKKLSKNAEFASMVTEKGLRWQRECPEWKGLETGRTQSPRNATTANKRKRGKKRH